MTDGAIYAAFSVAAAWAPLQWGALLLVVVAVCAPRLLPVIGRAAGRLLRAEVRRRAGLKVPGSPREEPVVDVLPPARREVGVRAGSGEAIHARERAAGPSPWGVLFVVGAAAAVLLWWLLRPR